MNERFAFDVAAAGLAAVAGADEAGRGCLAGPLVAAAVCFDYATFTDDDFDALTDLHDSKRLTRPRRETLCTAIVARAREVVVISCSPGTIDRDGLHRCNLALLGGALAGISPAPDKAFVDGFALHDCALPHEAVVGGDGRSAAIAAASVVAKVTRDRVMLALHDLHPEYGFDRHVGYATRDHQAAIATHGVCELHRLSFASVCYQQLDLCVEAAEADAH